MKGHIRERSPGRWAIVIDGQDVTGKRKRRWHSFKGRHTKREAQEECARIVSGSRAGTLIDPSKVTIAQFLDRWLVHMTTQLSPKSHERYSEIVRKNIVPAIGTVRLTKLRPEQISEFYARALTAGRRPRLERKSPSGSSAPSARTRSGAISGGALSPSTVTYFHRILKHALAQAVRWQMLPRSPAEFVKGPKIERAQMFTYDAAQAAELIELVRGTRLFVPVTLAVLCGLRRGEIAALRWRNVDLQLGNVAIVESAEQTTAGGVRYKPPKSGRSRNVALSQTVIDELRQYRLRQAEELLRAGIRQTDATFVYSRADGEPMQPRSLSQAWQMMIAESDLPRVRFHDLRHCHATLLLSSGVHPKIASERLGHSKVGITLDLYSHVLPGMQADAAARVDDALRTALQKRATNIR